MRETINAYLSEKESEGKAKSTLYEYNLYLSAFALACGKELADVTSADVVAWLVAERAKGYADASLLARYRALKIFFRWCVVNELLFVSPVKMKAPKVKRQRPRIADLAHVQKLLAHPVGNWIDKRNRALVHLLFDTGMRIGEAVGLAATHLDCSRRLVHIPAGKDGEARSVPFTRLCGDNLTAYLTARPPSSFDRWLMVGSLRGRPSSKFTTVGARGMLRKFCAMVGVPYINPHSLRHLFATRALNAGMRVEVVSKILGHSKVDITLKIYATLHTDTIQAEYDNLWEVFGKS